MRPPVRKLMRFGQAFEKSYDGLTTFAATLVVSVASASAASMMIRRIGFSSRPVSATGSQIASPNTSTVADVVRTPTSGNSVMVVGRPRAWPYGLIALAAAEPGEVRHVERQRGPERDHAHEGDREDLPEVGAPAQRAGLLDDRAEAAGLDDHEDHEAHEDDDQERGRPVLELLDRLHAPQDDDHVEGPEDREAQPHGPRLGGRGSDAERDRAGGRPARSPGRAGPP